MYVYRISNLAVPYTVGFFAPDGSWVPESDYEHREEAAHRVHYLNGGNLAPYPSRRP